MKQHVPEWTGQLKTMKSSGGTITALAKIPKYKPDVLQLTKFTGFESYVDRLSHSMTKGYH
jgi:3-dehydroquinate dehydratase